MGRQERQSRLTLGLFARAVNGLTQLLTVEFVTRRLRERFRCGVSAIVGRLRWFRYGVSAIVGRLLRSECDRRAPSALSLRSECEGRQRKAKVFFFGLGLSQKWLIFLRNRTSLSLGSFYISSPIAFNPSKTQFRLEPRLGNAGFV